MKHGVPPPEDVSRETPPLDIATLDRWLGLVPTPQQIERLERFEHWLRTEAVVAGGIGPAEIPRLRDRHLLDSLAYVAGITDHTAAIVDVGSGTGLPGIPLAIALPEATVTLVDRSQRRIDLARRAIRILRLDNVETSVIDVRRVERSWDVAVFRASLPIPEAAATVPTITGPTGHGLLGVSRRPEPPSLPPPPPGIAFDLADVGDPVLDSPFWLLTMHRSA